MQVLKLVMMHFCRSLVGFLKNYIRNSGNMMPDSKMALELMYDACGLFFNAIASPVQNLVANFECISYSGFPTWPVIK